LILASRLDRHHGHLSLVKHEVADEDGVVAKALRVGLALVAEALVGVDASIVILLSKLESMFFYVAGEGFK
jgi:hypothetical protein